MKLTFDVFDKKRKRDFNRPWYKYASELLPEPKRNKDKLLDIGCGLAEFSEISKERGYKVTCIDGRFDYVKHAENIGFYSIQVDLTKKLPFNDRTFDVAVALEVLEHIPTTESLLAEVNRILAPNGVFIVTIPNFASYINRSRYLFGKLYNDERYHFRQFTYSYFKKITNENGFKIVGNNSYSSIHRTRFHVKTLFWYSLLADWFVLKLQKIE